MDKKYRIPYSTVTSLAYYVSKRVPTGGFLNAVLSNDLKESFNRADLGNQRAMADIVAFCYNHIPSMCWGSPEKVKAWLANEHQDIGLYTPDTLINLWRNTLLEND